MSHNLLLLYIGVASSILIGYEHAANSCFLCFSYVIATDNNLRLRQITQTLALIIIAGYHAQPHPIIVNSTRARWV